MPSLSNPSPPPKRWGRLLMICILLLAGWVIFKPGTPKDGSASTNKARQSALPKPASTQTDNKPNGKDSVTLQDVSQSSSKAIKVTSAYVRQEQERLAARMAVTVRRLDATLEELHQQYEKSGIGDRLAMKKRFNELQTARDEAEALRTQLSQSGQSAWRDIFNRWQGMELEINTHLVHGQNDQTASL